MRWLKVVIWPILLVGLLEACGQDYPKKPLQWREEVQLSDGRVVWVERTASADGMHEMGGPSGIKNEHYSLRFSPPGDAPLPAWESKYRPMIFNYNSEKKEWYIVSSFYNGCETWFELEQPKYPYIEFVFRQGAWVRVPLDERLVGQKTNMYREIDLEKGEPFSIDLKRKATQRTGAWGVVYQRIITFEEVQSEYNYDKECRHTTVEVCEEYSVDKSCKKKTFLKYKEGGASW
ncbi:hypothetical protein ACFONG_14240 [Uliginosibacterium paludis]|uniref:Lipoprotein n=1 Tax=Uliginosibacterium paludis TaxID=1615952 RepID=A0ABV2CVV1_9RHOO